MSPEGPDPHVDRAWRPPGEYLDRLTQDVLPVYEELRRVLLSYCRAFREAIDAGPLSVQGDESSPRLIGWNEASSWSSAPYFLLNFPEAPESSDTNLGTERYAIRDEFWKAVGDVLEETQVLDADDAPGLPFLLDATLRTLELWATRPSTAGVAWHPPVYPWPTPDDDRWDDDPTFSLAERIRRILDRLRFPIPSWAATDLSLPQDWPAMEMKIRQKIEDMELRKIARLVLRGILQPPMVFALLTNQAYRRDEERRGLKEQKKELRNLGTELLRRPMSPETRWRLENVLTGWLDELCHADCLRENAESMLEALEEEAYEVGTGDWSDLTEPKPGSPGMFAVLATFIYEGIYKLRRERGSKLPPFKSRQRLHPAVLQDTAKVLSVLYPSEDLRTGSRSKLVRTLNKKFHSSGSGPDSS